MALFHSARRFISSQRLIIAAAGQTQSTVVQQISDIVGTNQGNVVDSQRMTSSGNFSELMLVEVPAAKLDNLLGDLSNKQLDVYVQEAEQAVPPSQFQMKVKEIYDLELVEKLEATVAALGASLVVQTVDSMPAPMGGSSLFKMKATLLVPPSVQAEAVRKALRQFDLKYNAAVSLKEE